MVKKGDTLFEIAKKHGVELDALIAANPQIADPNVIDVGMKIRVPFTAKPLPTPPAGGHVHVHKVVSGDTLWKLSKTWNLPLKAIIEANPHLKNPSVLMLGDVVYIPNMGPAEMDANVNPQVAGLAADLKKNTAPKAELLQPIAEEQPMPEANVTPLVPVAPAPMPNELVQPEVNPAPAAPEVVQPEAVMPPVAKPEALLPETMKTPAVQQPEALLPIAEKPSLKPELPSAVQPDQVQPFAYPEATKGVGLAQPNPCPPLPAQPMEQFYGALYGQPMVEYPYGTGVSQQAEHPFQQEQIPAVEAGAALPHLAGMHTGYSHGMPMMPMMPMMPYPYAPQGVQGAAADCGCDGGMMPQLPYAVSPYPGAVPMDQHAAPTVYPYGGAPNPWHQQQPGMAPCYPAGMPYEPLSTFATPYVNPYAPHGAVAPAGDCGCGGKGREEEATINAAPGTPSKGAPIPSKPAKKAADRSPKASKKKEKAVLHYFLEGRSSKDRIRAPKDSSPWINL